jgi:hypothetical protein
VVVQDMEEFEGDSWSEAMAAAALIVVATSTYGPGAPLGTAAKFLSWLQNGSGEAQDTFKGAWQATNTLRAGTSGPQLGPHWMSLSQAHSMLLLGYTSPRHVMLPQHPQRHTATDHSLRHAMGGSVLPAGRCTCTCTH